MESQATSTCNHTLFPLYLHNMAPSLRITAGPSLDKMGELSVNDDRSPYGISSCKVDARLTVRIKNFTGHAPEGKKPLASARYFEGTAAHGLTWSIQIQARFKEDVNADDLVFGNEFDKPIKNSLPWGTSIGLKAVSVIDPNLTHDLYADKPWAFSPLLATMNRASVTSLGSVPSSSASDLEPDTNGWPAFPTPDNDGDVPAYVQEDISPLFYEVGSEKQNEVDIARDELQNLKGAAWKADGTQESGGAAHALKTRVAIMSRVLTRKEIVIRKDHVVTTDFCNGFVDFNTLSIQIPYSGGWGFDLRKYWDGQPVRYVLKNKHTELAYLYIEFNITDLGQ